MAVRRMKSETRNDQNSAAKHNVAIGAKAARFIEFLLSSFATILLIFAAWGLGDAQFRHSGLFWLLGSVGIFVTAALIHWRHQYKDLRFPAIKTLIALTVWISIFTTLGFSSCWYTAFKDIETFNIVLGAQIISGNSPQSRFYAASSLGGDTIGLTPVNRLVHLTVTNKQSAPSMITGYSVEVADDSWWPTWHKLCRVDLKNTHLLFLDDERTATRNVFEGFDARAASSIPVRETISGWTGWQCPDAKSCIGKRLRIGVIDAGGAVSWQVVSKPSITPHLPEATLKPAEQITVSNPRLLSSCNR